MSATKKRTAYRMGFYTYDMYAGRRENTNPFQADSNEAQEWQHGWEENASRHEDATTPTPSHEQPQV